MITEVRRYTIEFADQLDCVFAGIILTKFTLVFLHSCRVEHEFLTISKPVISTKRHDKGVRSGDGVMYVGKPEA